MDPGSFLEPSVAIPNRYTTPDQGMRLFNDFIPIEQQPDAVTFESVNASLQQTLIRGGGVASNLLAKLSTDAEFQEVLEALDAELTLLPNNQGLRVEARRSSAAGRQGPSRQRPDVLRNVYDWFTTAPEPLVTPLAPTPAPTAVQPPAPPTQVQPESVFAPPPASVVPFVLPSISPTESFIDTVDLNTYGVQVWLFFQNEMIQFADLIAGHLSYKSVDQILRTGLEDVFRLASKLDESNRQFISSFKDAGTPVALQPGQTVRYEVAGPESIVGLSPAERASVNRLRSLTSVLQNPNLALSIYREERLRGIREQTLQMEWAALPAKMQTLYFTSDVSSAISYCLDIVHKATRLPRDTLLDTIIRSDARDPFAALVASRVKSNQVHTPNSYHTGVQYSEFESTYHSRIRQLSECTFEPTLLPPFVKLLNLSPYE